MSRSLFSLVSPMVQSKLRDPQGLKPAFLLAASGTAEAVPFPKPFVFFSKLPVFFSKRFLRFREPFAPFPKLFPSFSKLFTPFPRISTQALFMLALLAGIAAAQNSPPTVYAESYRKGPTRITEDKFELKLTSANPEYKQRLRDSSGAERYELTITPKIGEGEGNDKITSWLVGLYDLRHTIYGNLVQFDQESSEDPRDNLYWLNPVHSAPVPILARRIIKVEGFYVVFQVKAFHYNPPDTGYVDSMTVQWEFSNGDPREAENK